MKKSFVLHKDSLSILNEMPDEFAGKFIKAIYQYQMTAEVPEMDFALKLAVTPFINQFIRDAITYEQTCETKSLSGRIGNIKRWYPEIYIMFAGGEITLEVAEKMANEIKESQSIAPATNISHAITEVAKIADNDSKSDSDSDSKNDRKKGNKNEKTKYGINKNILLEKNEYDKLVSDYGSIKSNLAIDYLSNWGLEKPTKFKEYKNHNLTLRRWVFDAIEKSIKPKTREELEIIDNWFQKSRFQVEMNYKTKDEHNAEVLKNGYDEKYMLK